MIRLIGIDVDGTLLDTEGRMPEANRAAITEAVRRGVHVALVTGRSYPFARPVVAQGRAHHPEQEEVEHGQEAELERDR
jgi:hydroxymethylpyrimidine pyrophosphatase-like HAD family hydrolase